MKKQIAFLLLTLIALPAFAQEERSLEMQQKVTEKHKLVFDELGTWDGEMTMRMGPEPMKSKCVEKNWRMGKFWMVSGFKYEMNGQPMQGHGQFAYDSVKDKYVGTWIDGSGDQISVMEGDYDEATKTFTYEMTSKDPDGNDVKMRVKTTRASDTTKHFEMANAVSQRRWLMDDVHGDRLHKTSERNREVVVWADQALD